MLTCYHVTNRKKSLQRLCFHRCLTVHGGEGGSSVQGVLVRAVSASETPRMVTCGRYASYWNGFLLSLHTAVADQSKMSRISTKFLKPPLWTLKYLPVFAIKNSPWVVLCTAFLIKQLKHIVSSVMWLIFVFQKPFWCLVQQVHNSFVPGLFTTAWYQSYLADLKIPDGQNFLFFAQYTRRTTDVHRSTLDYVRKTDFFKTNDTLPRFINLLQIT